MNVARAGIVQPVAHFVCDATNRDQVARAEQRDRVLVGDPLAVERFLEGDESAL